jgi:hypothetical protein
VGPENGRMRRLRATKRATSSGGHIAEQLKPYSAPPSSATTPWLVYLLRCPDGSLYTGITNDLPKRLGGLGTRSPDHRVNVQADRRPSGDRRVATNCGQKTEASFQGSCGDFSRPGRISRVGPIASRTWQILDRPDADDKIRRQRDRGPYWIGPPQTLRFCLRAFVGRISRRLYLAGPC